MGITNFPNGLSSFGMVLTGNGIPATPGTVYFVDYGNGSDGVSVKSNSIKRPFKTISKAYGLATTNKDDVLCLMGSDAHTLTEMLTVAKNRVHFVGLDCASRMYGQNAKVDLNVTTAATDLGTILNTGVRNSFTNIKFRNLNTVAEGIYSVLEGGEYAEYRNCEFYKETDLDQTGAADLVLNGDSAQFYNCTIGSLANAISGTVIRANILLTKAIAGTGKVMRDCTFENCLVWRRSSHINNRFVYSAADADVERLLLFKNCGFINAANSTAVPAQAIAGAASFTVGAIVLDPTCYGVNITKMSTTTGVFVTGAAPAAGQGIAVNAA